MQSCPKDNYEGTGDAPEAAFMPLPGTHLEDDFIWKAKKLIDYNVYYSAEAGINSK